MFGKKLNSKKIRAKFLDFAKKEGHAITPSASVVPENDPSALFISAGVQPLVPYVMGESHPEGRNISNVQKCIRTQDIDEVGDNTHDTFFEMMGYWSFGDYFKEKSITQLYTFFVKELKLDPKKIYVTCFAGNSDSDRDTESAEIWKGLGIPEERIYFLEDNWWAVGEDGPCGPDSEVFYDVTDKGLNLTNKEDFLKADDAQEVVEIANSVFMQYKKENGVVVGELDQQNVDMGSGFERVVMAVQGKDNIFDTDLFSDLMEDIEKNSTNKDLRLQRIVADHVRTSSFMIADGVLPSNTDQGYILRRLIRRAVRSLDKLGMESSLADLIDTTIAPYKGVYENLSEKVEEIKGVITEEENKFRKTLKAGLKEFEKVSNSDLISGSDAFKLFSTYGFPLELTEELAEEKNLKVDVEEYQRQLTEHQEKSRTASVGKFKGGLAGSGEMETKYHTATHLLNAALREVLGDHVQQKGSNINGDRLRFDFSHPEKMTNEEKQKVTDIVNGYIADGLDVVKSEMSYEEAKNSGAIGVFEDKYGDTVSVYSIGDVSKELCGGPHVENTSALGTFRIKKEEASSAGVRRIKGVLG